MLLNLTKYQLFYITINYSVLCKEKNLNKPLDFITFLYNNMSISNGADFGFDRIWRQVMACRFKQRKSLTLKLNANKLRLAPAYATAA